MRFLYSMTAALLGLALCNDAYAASPSPRLVTHVGRFQSSELVAGASNRASETKLDSAARSLVSEKAGRPDASFGPSRVVELANGERIVKMPQTHKGLRVMGGGATVTFGADNVARMVTARLPEGLPDDVTPSVDAANAAAVAAKATGLPVPEGRTNLVIAIAAGRARLAYIARPLSISGVPFTPVVTVDAHSGEIIGWYNAAVTAKGNAYASNPTKSPDLAEVSLDLQAGATILENELVESLNCVDKKTTKQIPGFPIAVHVCELEATAVADANGDFLLPFPGHTEAEDPFSQVQMFYHTNRAYQFFRTFQADFDVNPGLAAPMPAISNLRVPDFSDFGSISNPNSPLQPFQNAFFSPDDQLFGTLFGTQGPAMYFGQGPVHDYGYDGDVIYHEFAHGAVNATLQLVGTAHLDKYGASHSNGGMNEGLADYFSSAITGDPDVGEYAAKDFDPSLKAIRSLAGPDKIPTAIGGEVHQDATLFSGALWDVRQKLSPTQASQLDAAVFSAMQKVPPPADLGYDELADVILKEVEASPLGKAGADDLTAAFTARGVLPDALRVIEYTGKTLTGPQELGGGLWFALGTSITQTKDYAPGIIQVRSELLERTTSITVKFEKKEVGAGNPFGGMGTPFTPKLLVKFGADPITFSDFTPTTPEGDVMVIDPTADGNTYSAKVDAPAGATRVYFMVGNSGQSDGAYTDIEMTSIQAPAPMGTGGAGGAGGTGAGGEDDTPSTNDDSGCGCALPGASDGPTGTLLVAAAGLALSLLRRRRSR
jgi:MYXO-CTERM domain-containing protein